MHSSWTAGTYSRGTSSTLLLQTPHVRPHHQQQVTQQQLDNLKRKKQRYVVLLYFALNKNTYYSVRKTTVDSLWRTSDNLFWVLFVAQLCVALQVHCTPLRHRCNATTMHHSSGRGHTLWATYPPASPSAERQRVGHGRIAQCSDLEGDSPSVAKCVTLYCRSVIKTFFNIGNFIHTQACCAICLCAQVYCCNWYFKGGRIIKILLTYAHYLSVFAVPCLSWSCGSVVRGWGCLGAGRWPCRWSLNSAGSFLAWTGEHAPPWMCVDKPWAEDSWQ